MPLNPLEITGGLAIGEGVGGAIEATVEPRLQNFKNDQWAKHQDVPLEPDAAAEIAAEDVDAYDRMATEATFSGIDAARFRDLWGVTLTAPGEGTLVNLLRRNAEVPIDFAHGLRKAKLEAQWDDAIRNLASARLTPAQLALGIVRSVVDDPGLQVGANDTTGGVVPAYPVSGIDTLAEALTGGIDKERLRVMVGEIGLPMSLQQAASAYFRKIIDLPDFYKAVAQGDTRPAWGPFILEQSRQIVTAHDGVQAHLRGWKTAAEMYAYAARHGMEPADVDVLYQIERRPLTPHAITTALARGGKFQPQAGELTDPYQAAVHQENLGPEWYDLAIANRYSYPSAFVVRSLLSDGALTQAEGEQIFLDVGWTPALAKSVAQHYAPTTTVALDPNVKKAHTKAWTEAQSSYIAEESTAADVQPIFDLLGVGATAAQEVIQTWDAIRALVRKQLTPKEIVKALGEGVTNPATGQPWTVADATAALMARGYSQADATVLIQE